MGGSSAVKWLQIAAFTAGLAGIGYYGYSVGDQYVYQAYGKWALNHQRNSVHPDLLPGGLLGRIDIARLHISSIVQEGTDTATLAVAVGHVPNTALPGAAGNCAVAAHRDTLFRGLRDIRRGDEMTFETADKLFRYRVLTIKITGPEDLSVLEPDGGGPVKVSDARDPGGHLLTLITCYPFRFIGPAPKRFVVQAALINANSSSGRPL